MFKKILIFIILLSSALLFNLILFPQRMIFLFQFAVTSMMLAVIIIQEIYGKNDNIKLNFKHPVFLIFTGVFLSMIIAQSYHNQNYTLTLWAQRFMYFYFFYFFLHILKPEIKELEKILVTLAFVYAASIFVQFIVHPTVIFDVRQDVDRGTIRIFIPGSGFVRLGLFFFLHRFYLKNNLKDIIPVLIFLSILILQGSRYSLAATALVLAYSLIFSKTIKSRYLIFIVVVFSMVPVYFIFQDIFAGLVEVTERQSTNIEDDIRIRAATFFLTDFFPNTLSYFFGNGQDHMGSIYGIRVHAYKIYQGFYQSDVGMVGDFSKFGLFFAIGALWLLIKAFRSPVKPEFFYLKYYILNAAIGLPVGNVFTDSSSIAIWCVMLYMLDYNIDALKKERQGQNPEITEESGTDDGKVSQRQVSEPWVY